MKTSRFLSIAALLSFGFLVSAAAPSRYAPPPVKKPSEETLKKIDKLKRKLDGALRMLRRSGIHDPILSDIEVYHKAAEWIVRHDEFYHKDAADWTVEALQSGLMRAALVGQAETPWFQKTGATVIHGYRSPVDNSIQPYAVTLPEDYGTGTRKWRVEVVLHGRDNSLTEVKFLHQHNGSKPAPKDLDYIRIDVYGRGNVAYRWAGEADLAEVIDHFLVVEKNMGRDKLLDAERGVLRGFSMGGAGVWHLGLHYPDKWCVLSPGAGFTSTHGYVKNLPKLRPEQEACLHIYDAVDYALNAYNVPIVSYDGSEDPQLQAARNMQERFQKLGISMKLLIAPGLGHKFPLEWKKKVAEARSEFLAKGRPEYPPRIRFTTWTLKYPSCHWLHLEGLEQHYRRATVDAERDDFNGFKVKTENVRVLELTMWPGATRQTIVVQIDGQRVEAHPYLPAAHAPALVVHLEKRQGHWRNVLPEKIITDRLRRPQKMPNLQGPIDDAFMNPFLCVRGTGKPWHESTQAYARANLERFRHEWSKYLRGELPIKDDVEVTPQDIAGKHLILFGDPASNSLIAQVVEELPFTWDKEKITWAGKEYAAGEHVPVLIYPSPLSPTRYVVLNSGHTFHAADFQGTNALLFPRLGDYAVLKLTPGEKKDPLAVDVCQAGLFDDFWKLQQKK